MKKRQSRFLALLRGINVGGSNVIGQADLRACFEAMGFDEVRTYIQSGNVLFRSDRTGMRELTQAVEQGLSKRFGYDARAVVLSRASYASAVRAVPSTWGVDDDRKHNALFTLAGVTPTRVLAQLPEPKDDLETVTAGPGVIFWSASRRAIARTTMMKVARLPVYKQMTVRNHRTVIRLLELLDG